jgi:hypothetical protein
MKLDTGMHIGLHLVFFGKSGVTGFAVRFKAFAVRSGRTAKPLFPVVS